MKFLEITFTDPELPGGVERFALQLGEFLSTKSIDVTYLFSGDKNEVYDKNGTKRIQLKCRTKLFPKIIFNLKIYFYVKRHKSDYDIIHINGDNGDLITRIRGIKTIMTVHGSALKDGLSAKRDRSIQLINRLYKTIWAYTSHIFEIYGIRRAGVIATTSPKFIDFIKVYRNNHVISVIPSGVDTNFFRPGEKNKIRKELSLSNSSLYGIWVGLNPERKRLNFAIDVIEKTNLNLICIGNTNTEKKVSNKIRLLGNISDRSLLAYYQASDFFLFPSVYEGFGLVVLEAMACGSVPIIGKDIEIPILFDRKNCFLAKNDLDYFNILKEIEEDKSILKKMSNEAVKSVYKLSVENNLLKYLQLIENYYGN